MKAAAKRRFSTRMSATAAFFLTLLAPATAQMTQRVSLDSSGTQGNGNSLDPSISADGRYVAFGSTATNFVVGDTNGAGDAFVRDRQASATERVSLDSSAAQGNGGSAKASISADGSFVTFASIATNLVSGDTNGTLDIFVRDRQGGATERASIDSFGAQANGLSDRPSISADGRYVVFDSLATNLVAGDTNGSEDIFIRDRQSGTTARVSLDSLGVQGNNRSLWPSISSDGRYVAFHSLATNLDSGDTNGTWDVFVHDRQSGATERISLDTSGLQGNAQSLWSSISADGRFVAFGSQATNLVSGDTNGDWDVFVRDRQAGATERVSVDSFGVQANGGSDLSSISADGRYVAFESFANNLVVGDTNGNWDIFVRDRQSGATERASVDSFGGQGIGDSYNRPSISADGRHVAFQSVATNLTAGDTNGTVDIFVRDRQSGVTAFCFGDGSTIPCPCANNGGVGRGCSNSLFAAGAQLTGAGTTSVASDSLVLSASGMTGSVALFFQGASQLPPAMVDDGLGCVGGPIIRLGTKTVASNTSSFPQGGDPLISVRGAVPAGGAVRWYQCFYRNAAAAFCPPATSNRTNGVIIAWAP